MAANESRLGHLWSKWWIPVRHTFRGLLRPHQTPSRSADRAVDRHEQGVPHCGGEAAPNADPSDHPTGPARIRAEYRGEIAIIRIETDHLHNDGVVKRCFEEVTAALGPRRRLILDTKGVVFWSSTAFSKLILLERKCRDGGGRIILCNLNPVARQAFRISNLDRLLQIVSTPDEALMALGWTLAITCPITGCAGDGLTHDASIAARGGELCCRSCGCRFRVAPFQLSPSGDARVEVSRFETATYEQERILAVLGSIVHLGLVGRLDLFAAEALVDAWRSLPESCQTLLDLRQATDFTEQGLRLLDEHVGTDIPIDRVVVVVDSSRSDRIQAVMSNVRVATTPDEGTSALRDSAQSHEAPAPLLVTARTVERAAKVPPGK
jgi:anti-anti-sigma factor